MSSDFAESERGGRPAARALANARGKARVVSRANPGATVLGADTVVVLDGSSIGSPDDAAEAAVMIAALAGRTHEVITAVCVIADGSETTALECTAVCFRDIAPRMLAWYVGTGEWQGRAGGYAVQGAGWALVDRLVGDYSNVVGLPVTRVREMLAAVAAPR